MKSIEIVWAKEGAGRIITFCQNGQDPYWIDVQLGGAEITVFLQSVVDIIQKFISRPDSYEDAAYAKEEAGRIVTFCQEALDPYWIEIGLGESEIIVSLQDVANVIQKFISYVNFWEERHVIPKKVAPDVLRNTINVLYKILSAEKERVGVEKITQILSELEQADKNIK